MRFCSLTVVFVFGSFLGVLKNKAWGTSGVGYDFWLEADMIGALAMSIHRVKWRHSPWSRHVRRVCCWDRSRSPLYRSTLTYRALHGSAPPYLASSFTCRTDAGSGPPPLNSLTFRLVVGQLSEVVPFLLLEQRCGMACQGMLRRPRRCRCLRTWSRHHRHFVGITPFNALR